MYEGKDDSMMKKFMALFLALMFALLCTAAMAEGSTESVVSIPNGDHEVPATVCMPSGEGTLEQIDGEHIGVMGWSQGGTDALLCAARAADVFTSVVTWAGAPDLSDMLTDELYEQAKANGYFVMDFDWREPLNVSLQWCEDVKNTDVPSMCLPRRISTPCIRRWTRRANSSARRCADFP